MKKHLKLFALALFFTLLGAFVSFAIFNGKSTLKGIPEPSSEVTNLFGQSISSNKNESTSESKQYIDNKIFMSSTQLEFTADSNNVRPLGRTVYNDGIRWLSMSGSGVEFTCTAQTLKIVLTVYNSPYISYSHRPKVGVYINGETATEAVLDKEENELSFDMTQYGEKAKVQIVKLSEAMFSCAGIKSIEMYGTEGIIPTEMPKIRFEFIGDSITCGYGLDSQSNTGSFTTRTENFAKTYAFLAAKQLNADCSAVCYSGYGVYTGFSSNGALNNSVIFNHYEKALHNFSPSYLGDYWDFTSYQPNIVVINLGTNDASCCSTAERRENFKNEYKKLLHLVRLRNSSAYILCVLGDMNNSLYSEIEKAVSEYRMETNDFSVSSRTLSFEMGTYGSTIDGHPNAESNRLAAQTLCDALMELGLHV